MKPPAWAGLHSGLLLAIFVSASWSGGDAQEAGRRALIDIPPVKQPYALCLAASVSMVLGHWGVFVPPASLAERVALYKSGTTARDYVAVLEELGFAAFLVQPPFQDLLTHLERQRPVIVAWRVGRTSRHTVVLLGFDAVAQTVQFNDPASGERESVPVAAFRRRWEDGERWTFLIVPKRTPNP